MILIVSSLHEMTASQKVRKRRTPSFDLLAYSGLRLAPFDLSARFATLPGAGACPETVKKSVQKSIGTIGEKRGRVKEIRCRNPA
jgi:hypothetical protein